jgi:hypothetical protein
MFSLIFYNKHLFWTLNFLLRDSLTYLQQATSHDKVKHSWSQSVYCIRSAEVTKEQKKNLICINYMFTCARY